MYPGMPLRKSVRLRWWFAASFFLVDCGYSAGLPPRRAQESPQQQQTAGSPQQSPQPKQSAQTPAASPTSQQAEPKQKRVWTNDDVITLRTPADIYLAQKAAQETAAAEAAAKEATEATQVKEGCPTEKLPATFEETHKLIAAKQNQIADYQQALDRYTAEFPNEPAEHKDQMQSEIKRITLDLPKERLELKELQDHLEELTKAQGKEAPAVPAPPPPS